MRILALALLLVVTACATPEQGTPTKDPFLSGPLTFREVEADPVPTGPPASDYPVPQPSTDDPAVEQARTLRQTADEPTRKHLLTTFDCSAPDPLLGKDDKALPLVTCGADGFRYALGPVFLDGDRVMKATAEPDQNGSGHVVTVKLDQQGAQIFGDFTAANIGTQVAILVNSRVLSAPTIQSAIPGGVVQIYGKFTKAEAEQLAAHLNGE